MSEVVDIPYARIVADSLAIKAAHGEDLRPDVEKIVADVKALWLEEAARLVAEGCPTAKATGRCCAGCDHAGARIRQQREAGKP